MKSPLLRLVEMLSGVWAKNERADDLPLLAIHNQRMFKVIYSQTALHTSLVVIFATNIRQLPSCQSWINTCFLSAKRSFRLQLRMMRGSSRLSIGVKIKFHNLHPQTTASDLNPGRKIFDRSPEDPNDRVNTEG